MVEDFEQVSIEALHAFDELMMIVSPANVDHSVLLCRQGRDIVVKVDDNLMQDEYSYCPFFNYLISVRNGEISRVNALKLTTLDLPYTTFSIEELVTALKPLTVENIELFLDTGIKFPGAVELHDLFIVYNKCTYEPAKLTYCFHGEDRQYGAAATRYAWSRARMLAHKLSANTVCKFDSEQTAFAAAYSQLFKTDFRHSPYVAIPKLGRKKQLDITQHLYYAKELQAISAA